MEIIAHRGFNGRFPEMSELAYEKALELPIHGVECDVRLSKNGELVCVHDAHFLRVAGDPRRVSTLTMSEIRHIPIEFEGLTSYSVSLDDLLDLVLPTGKHLYIETKHPVAEGRMVEEAVALCLERHGLLHDERIHLISFSHLAMRRARKLMPDIDRYYLRRDWEQRVNPRDIQLSRPTGLGLSVERARRHVELVGAQGLKTYVWTANTIEELHFCYTAGVDYVATDFPDRGLEVVASLSL
ncbi:glycerophosphoryl diester phosphodiesterase [Corynebacterium kutscheri]|uniref:Glycerophosphoryl diester phosphodiesterase n=1 Tax=Corynebacterium kutscheri TaxID=35755 RepID=A0AB38VQM6_9CORY|nr:glycerophosphodiester phosphodiesterase family protein [Corynebacterium kutscheri]VEH05866.1 glycerophosphoryl diester phosphodiesterase [Corynebacterium kutscheri]VEH81758.1 glycerophosphoryl diester phosphodiesterase [Corynebacterium kutscheri]